MKLHGILLTASLRHFIAAELLYMLLQSCSETEHAGGKVECHLSAPVMTLLKPSPFKKPIYIPEGFQWITDVL